MIATASVARFDGLFRSSERSIHIAGISTTTATGSSTTNPFQFTGRENDGTGVYSYRARYYSPLLQRFIGEDPVRSAGGVNQYAYVGDNPESWTDPAGLWSTEGHNNLYRNALPGVPPELLRKIEECSRIIDSRKYQGPGFAAWHGMAEEGQTEGEAQLSRLVIISNMLSIARHEAMIGNCLDAACNLGAALHPLTDQYSPVHHNYKNNRTSTWNPPRGNFFDHSPWDWWGKETSGDITDAIRNAIGPQARLAYEYVFGHGSLAGRKR